MQTGRRNQHFVRCKGFVCHNSNIFDQRDLAQKLVSLWLFENVVALGLPHAHVGIHFATTSDKGLHLSQKLFIIHGEKDKVIGRSKGTKRVSAIEAVLHVVTSLQAQSQLDGVCQGCVGINWLHDALLDDVFATQIFDVAIDNILQDACIEMIPHKPEILGKSLRHSMLPFMDKACHDFAMIVQHPW